MPTIKQKIAASKLVENGGNMGKAMRAAGYSSSMAKNPQKLTSSLGWHELMNKYYLVDESLLKLHQDLLYATKYIRIGKTKIKVPDGEIRLRSLDLAFKIKGKYKQAFIIDHDLDDDKTPKEIADELRELDKKMSPSHCSFCLQPRITKELP